MSTPASFRHALFLCIVITSVFGQCSRENNSNRNILSRPKRYLSFIRGTKFIVSMVASKVVESGVPTKWQTIMEMDLPFDLPDIPAHIAELKKTDRHKQKREVLNQLKGLLETLGLNGTACAQKIQCQVQQYLPSRGKSLVQDLMLAIFTYPLKNDGQYFDETITCDETVFHHCPLPLLDSFLQGNFII